MKKLIIFFLSFFMPWGFNYIYLGLKRKGVFFLAIFMLLFGISYGEVFLPLLLSISIAIGIIFFYDCLEIVEKRKYHIFVEDDLKFLENFLKNHPILVIVFTLSLSTIFTDIPTEMMVVIILPQIVLFMMKVFIYMGKNEDELYKQRVARKKERGKNKNQSLMLKEGYIYMDTIMILGEELKTTKIWNHVREVEETTYKILDFVETNPQKAKELKKFMEYYLPTTIKLIKTYHNLQKENGKRATRTMKKIEDTMYTIVEAFKKQLDNLFEDTEMDISADIKTLGMILENEGL